MKLFALNNIITKFNKLKQEIDDYITSQNVVIENLETRLETEKTDRNTAERLRKTFVGEVE